jgi:hypothetical protein
MCDPLLFRFHDLLVSHTLFYRLAIGDNHAILHDIKNISANANLKVGDEISLAADEQGGYSFSVEPGE